MFCDLWDCKKERDRQMKICNLFPRRGWWGGKVGQEGRREIRRTEEEVKEKVKEGEERGNWEGGGRGCPGFNTSVKV